MDDSCCNCNCHKVDIVAISIPENKLKERDRFEALQMADKIMKHNNQNKQYIKVQENWSNFLVYYENMAQIDLRKIKIKKFDNDIALFLRLPT